MVWGWIGLDWVEVLFFSLSRILFFVPNRSRQPNEPNHHDENKRRELHPIRSFACIFVGWFCLERAFCWNRSVPLLFANSAHTQLHSLQLHSTPIHSKRGKARQSKAGKGRRRSKEIKEQEGITHHQTTTYTLPNSSPPIEDDHRSVRMRENIHT